MRIRINSLQLIGISIVALTACSAGDDAEAEMATGESESALRADGGRRWSPDAGGAVDAASAQPAPAPSSTATTTAGTTTGATTGTVGFTEITSSSGLASVQSGMVWTFDSAIEDFDGDGKLDLFLGDHDTTNNQNRLAHNNGGNSFSNKLGTTLTSLTGVWSFVGVDANNDGSVDAIVDWDSQNSSAFANNNAGSFTKVTSPFDHQANGAAWADYDGDGFVDFAVTNLNGTNRVWHHKSNGLTATDFEQRAGVPAGKSSAGVYLADVNGDGRPDLITQTLTNGAIFDSATGCTTRVSLNDGSGGFGAPNTAGLDHAPCYGIALGDYDNDGDLDLAAVGAIPGGSSAAGSGYVYVSMGLFRNNGSGIFTDVSTAAQLPTASIKADIYRHLYDQAVWVDLDQDGYLDLVATVGTTDRVFRNLGNLTFQDVTSTWKLSSGNGRPERLSVGDIDGDGDVDLMTQSGQGNGYRLWRNDAGSSHWLTVRLAGTKIKTAISSKISLYDAGHAGDPSYLRGYREVMVGASHRAPLEQTFGTTAGKAYDVVARFWPSGTIVTIPSVSAGKRLRIGEDHSSSTY